MNNREIIEKVKQYAIGRGLFTENELFPDAKQRSARKIFEPIRYHQDQSLNAGCLMTISSRDSWLMGLMSRCIPRLLVCGRIFSRP